MNRETFSKTAEYGMPFWADLRTIKIKVLLYSEQIQELLK